MTVKDVEDNFEYDATSIIMPKTSEILEALMNDLLGAQGRAESADPTIYVRVDVVHLSNAACVRRRVPYIRPPAHSTSDT